MPEPTGREAAVMLEAELRQAAEFWTAPTISSALPGLLVRAADLLASGHLHLAGECVPKEQLRQVGSTCAQHGIAHGAAAASNQCDCCQPMFVIDPQHDTPREEKG